MMTTKDILSKSQKPIIWTLFYGLSLFILLLWLFNFNLFSMNHWHILSKARLSGFAGFTFSLMIFAMIPIYIATIYSIIKRGNYPTPFAFLEKLHKTAKPAPVIDENKPKEKKEEKPEFKLPQGAPAELYGPFVKALSMPHPTVRIKPKENKEADKNAEQDFFDIPIAVAQSENKGDRDLPVDFDFDFGFNQAKSEESDAPATPVFENMDFGDDSEESELASYFSFMDIKHRVEDDIIFTDKFAIIQHMNSETWDADTLTWTSDSGTEIESPILRVIKAAALNDLQPVIYLQEQNIKDLDEKIKDWESSGVKVIKTFLDAEELL